MVPTYGFDFDRVERGEGMPSISRRFAKHGSGEFFGVKNPGGKSYFFDFSFIFVTLLPSAPFLPGVAVPHPRQFLGHCREEGKGGQIGPPRGPPGIESCVFEETKASPLGQWVPPEPRRPDEIRQGFYPGGPDTMPTERSGIEGIH